MCTKCENCEMLLKMEEDRIKWYKELAVTNISLHKQISDQNDLITILKKKLLDKRTYYLSQTVVDLLEHIDKLSNKETAKEVKTKIHEVNEFLEIFHEEKKLLDKEVEDTEKYYQENISIDYFRDCLFEELDKSNKLKLYFVQETSRVADKSHDVLLSILKNEGNRLNNELKSRYQKTIVKGKEEIERQNLLVSKLKHHNRQLYTLLQKTKKENEEQIHNMETNLHYLKLTIEKLKDKNSYLHTQIKLEVEGCRNDIFDARKTIKKLVKPNLFN